MLQQQQQLPGPHQMHKPMPMGPGSSSQMTMLNYDPRFGPQQPAGLSSNVSPGTMYPAMHPQSSMSPLSPVPQSIQNNPSMLSDPRQTSIFNSSTIGVQGVGGNYPGQIISHPNSVGYWLYTESMYGNNVLPILPRL